MRLSKSGQGNPAPTKFRHFYFVKLCASQIEYSKAAKELRVSEETKKQPFKLHLPGLLKVLAEHLYSNKQVAVRELIQNAHDGCTRRRAEARETGYQPRIDISIDAPNRTVSFSDNGFGLTESEIEDYLATIGRSYTRELRDNLNLLSPDKAAELIGQFGFGFLSAFLLASHVRVVTRSLKTQSENEAFEWRSTGNEDYEMRPARRTQAGTTIELEVKGSASFVLREQMLLDIIRQYADFLPIAIHLNGDPTPANLMKAPWLADDVESATQNYIERAFKTEAPLCVIPLHDGKVELGHDSINVPLNGFLFVPQGSVASLREYGDLRVFIRNMFIRGDERNLLPPWARFVRGVIDCPMLQPTASREDIHQDETFGWVQTALEEQLAEGLRQIAHDEPDVWKQIVRGHSDVITGWAVQDNSFFEAVADIVSFRTSRGHLTLPEYAEQSGGTLYYVTRELGSLQEQMLAEGHGVPVIDASWFAVAPFLHKYAARHSGTNLVRLDGEGSELLRAVEDEAFSSLINWYDRQGVRAQVASFRPHEAPALMFYPEDAEFILESRKAMGEGEIPDPLARLMGDYVENLAADKQIEGTLYLNASCPLVRRLAAQESSTGKSAACTLILQIARLFSGRTLTARDAASAFGEITKSLDGLLP